MNMNIYKLFEIFLYEFIDLVPNIILTITAFRDNLHISKLRLGIISIILYLLLSGSRILAMTDIRIATFLTILWVMLYLFFYRMAIREKLTKLLFVLLIILNYGSFSAIVVNHISVYRMLKAAQPYSLTVSLVYIMVLIVSYPIIYLLMERKIRPLMNSSKNNWIWRFLWMIPAVFCLSYYYNLYENGGTRAFSADLKNVLFAIAFNAGALFVTYLTIRLVEESDAYLQLKAENYQLNLQFLQYENLKNRMEEFRRTKHDLRQILTIVQSYVLDNNKTELLAYLAQYINSLPANPCILYCDNYALNALLVYYEEMAGKQQIIFRAEIQYTPSREIADTDIVVLLGNLLENAIEACMRQKDEGAFIAICVKTMEEAVVITVDNSYRGQIHRQGQKFLSSKENHTSMGITSIQKIAEKYHGIAKFEYKEKLFCASVLIYP